MHVWVLYIGGGGGGMVKTIISNSEELLRGKPWPCCNVRKEWIFEGSIDMIIIMQLAEMIRYKTNLFFFADILSDQWINYWKKLTHTIEFCCIVNVQCSCLLRVLI